MNTTMFLTTMLDVLKYDSKFKAKKDVLLPILRRCYVNSLPQYEFVRYGRSGQRYENVEIRVPIPLHIFRNPRCVKSFDLAKDYNSY